MLLSNPKIVLASIGLNALVVIFFGFRTLSRPHVDATPQIPQTESYNRLRSDVFRSLHITTNDIVFVGNSITEGFPVTEIYGPGVKNRGIGGNFTWQMLARVPAIAAGHPRKVFIEGGVNDVRYNIPADTTLGNIGRMIDAFRAISPKTVIVLQSIFPTNDRFDPALKGSLPRIIAMNERFWRLAAEKNVQYVNIFPAMGGVAGLDSTLTGDGLHLNSRGYSVWEHAIDSLVK